VASESRDLRTFVLELNSDGDWRSVSHVITIPMIWIEIFECRRLWIVVEHSWCVGLEMFVAAGNAMQ